MKVGFLGPASWATQIDQLATVHDVQWGTDDLLRAKSLIVETDHLDAVIVEGKVSLLTSEIVNAIRSMGARALAVAPKRSDTQWIDAISGVERIDTLDALVAFTMDEKATHSGESVGSTVIDKKLQRGKVLAVWGPQGSPGVSTLAISIAVAASKNGRSVFLCDADTRGASLAIGLGLFDDVPGFAAACRLAGRGELTHSEFLRLSLEYNKHGAKISVLTGLPRASRWAEVTAPKARLAIDALRDSCDLTVVDVGSGIEENEWIDGAPQRDGAARAILSEADVVVAVGLSDAVGIARLIRGLDELRELCENPLVVVNKTTRQSAREAVDAIERFSSHSVEVCIPKDSRGGLEDAAARSHTSTRLLWAAVAARTRDTDSKGKR